MLYTPADDREMMNSALDTAADAVILDLEDAVPRDGLAGARENVTAVAASTDAAAELCVRVNGVETDVWVDDVLAVADAADALVVPMVESPEGLATVATVADRAATETPEIVPTLETPTGVLGADELAARAADFDQITALSLGLEDYARALGTTGRPDAVRDFVGVSVASAAATGGLEPLYTVYADYEDLDGLAETAAWAADLGYRGMKAIHPRQVPVINEAFTPSASAAKEAERYVTAYDESDRDSLSVDGTFLDAAIVDQYRDILRRYRASADRDD